MRRRWTTLAAAVVCGATAAVALPSTAHANWHPWESRGGAAVHSGPGRASSTTEFARNAEGKLAMWWEDLWTPRGWTQLGDRPMLDGPAVVRGRKPGGHPTEVYYRSPDNQVRLVSANYECATGIGCRWFTGDYQLGGDVRSAPAATYLGNNRIDVFARGANGRLQHTWQYGAAQDPWAQWEDLGGITFTEHPSAVTWWSGNRLDVFVKGGDGHLWQKWWTSSQGWSGWHDLGGTMASAPSVIASGDNRLDVFARGANNTLIHRWWIAGSGWSAWEDLGGDFRYAPVAVGSVTERRISVYVTGASGQLESRSWH